MLASSHHLQLIVAITITEEIEFVIAISKDINDNSPLASVMEM